MIKGKLFLITLLLAFTFGCRKDMLQWHSVEQLNSFSNNTIYSIKFINDKVCVACGGYIWSEADLFISTDGGFNWTKSSFPKIGKAMFNISLSSFGGIYMCGVDGDVLYSTDSCKNWKFGRINDWKHYVSGTFITPDTGIFVNTTLQREGTITQIDSNFNIINQQTFQVGFNKIYMLNQSTGYIAGYGGLLKTTDYRKTWKFQDVSGDNFTAMDIHGDEIWMCGFNGSVYHTFNGGNDWKRLRNGDNNTIPHYGFWDIAFSDKDNGWITCDNGKVLYSNDGGNHWMEYRQFTNSALHKITFCPNGDLIVVGDNGSIFRIKP